MSDTIHTQWTSDMEKVMQDLHKSNAALERKVANLRQVNREGKGATKSVEGLGAKLPAMLSLGAAIGAVAKGLQDSERAAEAAAENLRNMTPALKALMQQSGGDVALMQKYEDIARRITLATGIKQGVTGAAVQRGMALGLSEQDLYDIFGTAAFEAAPEHLITAVGRLRKVFGEDIAQLSSRAILNAMLVAQTPTELGASPLSLMSLSIGEFAKQIGGTLSESMALTAFGATGAGTPEIGANQALQFLAKLAIDPEGRFAGKGVIGAFKTFLTMSEREQGEYIGERKEARIFMGKLQNPVKLAEYQAMVAATEAGIAATGTAQGAYGKLLAGAMANPKLAADLYEKRMRAKLDIAWEPAGLQERKQDAVIADIKSRYAKHNWVDRYWWNTELALYDLLNIDASRIPRWFFGTPVSKDSELGRTRRSVEEEYQGSLGPSEQAAEKLKQAAAHLENAASSLDTGTLVPSAAE